MNTTTLTVPATSAPSYFVRDMRAAIHSEWIKLRSVRATTIFVGVAAIVGVAMSLILGKVVKTDPYEHLPFTIGNTFIVSTWLTTLFAVVAGTLVFTSEVQHGTLAGALTARAIQDDRRRCQDGSPPHSSGWPWWARSASSGARRRRRQRDEHRRPVRCGLPPPPGLWC